MVERFAGVLFCLKILLTVIIITHSNNIFSNFLVTDLKKKKDFGSLEVFSRSYGVLGLLLPLEWIYFYSNYHKRLNQVLNKLCCVLFCFIDVFRQSIPVCILKNVRCLPPAKFKDGCFVGDGRHFCCKKMTEVMQTKPRYTKSVLCPI